MQTDVQNFKLLCLLLAQSNVHKEIPISQHPQEGDRI